MSLCDALYHQMCDVRVYVQGCCRMDKGSRALHMPSQLPFIVIRRDANDHENNGAAIRNGNKFCVQFTDTYAAENVQTFKWRRRWQFDYRYTSHRMNRNLKPKIDLDRKLFSYENSIHSHAHTHTTVFLTRNLKTKDV